MDAKVKFEVSEHLDEKFAVIRTVVGLAKTDVSLIASSNNLPKFLFEFVPKKFDGFESISFECETCQEGDSYLLRWKSEYRELES